MTRLVAVQHADPTAVLGALDAAWAAGDALLPIDPARDAAAIAHRMGAAVLHTADGTTDLDGLPLPDGTALVVLTSGSTGAPDGVVLSHVALDAATAASRDRLGATDGQGWLGVLPLHHVAGISVVLRSRAAGVEPALHPRDSVAVVDAAAPSWISLVPTQLDRLLRGAADLARHHGVLLGGAAAPDDLLRRAARAGVHVVTSYGATETVGGVVYDGHPLDDVDVAVADDGRVRLRTPTIATGLRRDDGSVEPVTDPAGWWWTNDLGRVDDDGRLVVLGRADDVVVSGGENVPLGPVRDAVAALPDVAASAVVGLPHPRWGTSVTAVLVPEPDAAAPTLDDVRAALRPLLPASHLPTGVVVAPALPTSGIGKVTAQAVAAAVAGGIARLDRGR